MLIFGKTSTGIVVPVQVDANGSLQVDAIMTDDLGVPIDLDASGRLSVNQHGWYSGAWQKSPLPWGYSGTVLDSVINLNLAAGANNLSGQTVPAGEVWVITNIVMRYTGAVAGVQLYMFIIGSIQVRLYAVTAVVSNIPYDRQGQWILGPGENLQLSILGATLNDDGLLNYSGYKVDLDQ